MATGLISKKTIDFLNDLKTNNNRPWFTESKKRYQNANDEIKTFLAALVDEMNKSDSIESFKLFRIYRDVRFSKDKTPYNYHFSMSMSRTKPYLRGGYYVRITPDESAIACGFWGPNPKDLKLIRQNIEVDAEPFRRALKSKELVTTFGDLEGDQVKTAPKGYSKDHPAIDLLRYKQFILSRKYSDKEVCATDFVQQIARSFQTARPWFDYMSDVLTHNLNGEPLY